MSLREYLATLTDESEKAKGEKKLKALEKLEQLESALADAGELCSLRLEKNPTDAGAIKEKLAGVTAQLENVRADIEDLNKWTVDSIRTRSDFADKAAHVGLLNPGDSVSECNYSFYGVSKQELKAIFDANGLVYLSERGNFSPSKVPDGWEVTRENGIVKLVSKPSNE